MSTSIIPFQFESSSIRIITHADGAWSVVAKDVAESLGYAWAGIATIKHVPDEWRGVNSVLTPSGEQDMHTLAEQGLYFFLGRSDKPKALPFQKWVYGDVIPSIRKTGSYSVPNAADFALPKTKAEALFLAAEQARIIEEQEAILTEQEPKVLLYDQLAESDGLIRFPNLLGMLKGKTGQDYKMADLKLFLRKAGFLCWTKELEPTVKAIDSGWFAVRYEDRAYDGVIHKVPEWAVTPNGFIAIWNVVAQPQRRYGQAATQTVLLVAANAAQQEMRALPSQQAPLRDEGDSRRTYTATDIGKMMNPPLSAILVNRQLNIAGLIRREYGYWIPTESAAGMFELTDVEGRRHSNGTPVKQIRWFKTVLDVLATNRKEAA